MTGRAAFFLLIVYALGCQGFVWLLTLDRPAALSTDTTGGVVAGAFTGLALAAAVVGLVNQIRKRNATSRVIVFTPVLALGVIALIAGYLIVQTLRAPAATFRNPLPAWWGTDSYPVGASYKRTTSKRGRVVGEEFVTGAALNAEARATTLGFYVAAGVMPLGLALRVLKRGR